MIDSIQTAIKTIENISDNGIDLITKVDSFYNSAWDKLIIVVTLSFAIIGILIPFVIQWYQKKTLNISESLLKKEIEAQTIKIKEELLAEIKEELTEKLIVFEKNIEKIKASSDGKSFHIQGNMQFKNGLIRDALGDFIAAAGFYLVGEDYLNLQTVMKSISETYIPELSIEEIEDLKILRNSDLDSLLSSISEKDEKNVFTNVIREIRIKLSKLPKTIMEKDTKKVPK